MATYISLVQFTDKSIQAETAASVSLAADMLGNIRTQKWAFTVSKMEKILAKVP